MKVATIALAFTFLVLDVFSRVVKADENGLRRRANAKPCMRVILTGTMGGPGTFNGLAGSGTLITYGTSDSDCSDYKLQFDIGRGTTTRLSNIGLRATDIDAIFLTHIHSDHADDLAIFMQYRWFFNGDDIDIICAVDPALNCTALAEHIADPYIQAGEIDQRLSERPFLKPGGPSDLTSVNSFTATDAEKTVWSRNLQGGGNIKVDAIRSNHIGGHASYRVSTPAGAVVIGGDASNDSPDPATRPFSTSESVEKLSKNADALVHSCIHPVYKNSGFPQPVFNRQSSVPDLGAMAERAKVDNLVLTHLFPPIGADAPFVFPVPGGPLTIQDYEDAAINGGFTGEIYVGTDLITIEISK